MAAGEHSRHGAKRLWLGLVGLGLALVASGFVVPLAAGSSAYLGERDAQEYLDAAVALHGQTMPKEGESVSAETVELTRARRRFVDARAKVETARQTRDWLPRGLQLVGVALLAVGFLGGRVAAS